jgi:ketosteroid isomerase-like protein
LTLEELLEIESIKQTRTLGARHLDAGDWDALADLYTSDARCEFGPYGTWEDQSTFARLFREAEAPFVKVGPYSNLHVIVNHVVELTSPDTATGMLYLLDFVTGDMMRASGNPLYWLGIYDEEYRKVDGRWKIARQSLNFIWPERTLNDGFLDRHANTALTPTPPRATPGSAADFDEICQLSARYARGLDAFDMDALLEPFSDDAIFDAGPMGLDAYAGKDALREFFGHNQEVMADQMHLFGNFVVDFDGADAAHGTNYLLQDGHNRDGATVKCFCRNDDTYVRVAGRWRIAIRQISPLMPPQLEDY